MKVNLKSQKPKQKWLLEQAIITLQKSHLPAILLLFAFCVFALTYLFHSGLWTAHDIWHNVARLYHYSQALSEGRVLPHWISTLAQGHGYPLFYFSYHTPWFIGGPLVLLGLSVESAIKAVFLISYCLAGFGMYLLTHYKTKNKIAAFTAALLYTWAPYHFLTIFVSAAIGTAVQFALFPFILLGILLLNESSPRNGLILTAVTMALSILAHLMTFVFLFPFVLGFFLVQLISQHTLSIHQTSSVAAKMTLSKLTTHTILFMVSIIVGVGLAAYYLLPLVSLLSQIKANEAGNGFSEIYLSNFATLKQLIYSRWGYGPIISNAKDGEISLQVGVAQWLAVVGASGLLLLQPILKKFLSVLKLTKEKFLFISGILLLFFIAIVAMIDLSKPIWKLAVSVTTLDYPFRLLLVTVMFGSLLAGLIVAQLSNWNKKIAAVVAVSLVMVAIYTNRNHRRVNLYTEIPLDLYVRSEVTTNTYHEYLPKSASSELLKEEQGPFVIGHIENTQVIDRVSDGFTVSFDASEAAQVSLRQFDFPGQIVTVNNEKILHSTDDLGRISFPVDAGHSLVTVRAHDTKISLLGKFITGTSIALLVGSAYFWRKRI